MRTIKIMSNLKIGELEKYIDPLYETKLPASGAICDCLLADVCKIHKPCFAYEITIKKIKK